MENYDKNKVITFENVITPINRDQFQKFSQVEEFASSKLTFDLSSGNLIRLEKTSDNILDYRFNGRIQYLSEDIVVFESALDSMVGDKEQVLFLTPNTMTFKPLLRSPNGKNELRREIRGVIKNLSTHLYYDIGKYAGCFADIQIDRENLGIKIKETKCP